MAKMIATLTTARKPHACQACGDMIYPGDKYISETISGGGLGSIKFPDRYHLACYEMVKQNRNESCLVVED
jgi:hypothetical protein